MRILGKDEVTSSSLVSSSFKVRSVSDCLRAFFFLYFIIGGRFVKQIYGLHNFYSSSLRSLFLILDKALSVDLASLPRTFAIWV